MTSKFVLHYQKLKPIDVDALAKTYIYESKADENHLYNPYLVEQIQTYNPLYSTFFELNETNYNKVSLNHKYHVEGTEIPGLYHTRGFHMKYAPLLDPLHYLSGKYDIEDASLRRLPSISNTTECFPKLASINNVSYIDSFFSFLTSQMLHTHKVVHGIDYYGSYLGIQKVFKTTITDDLEYLYSSPHFTENVGKYFTIGGGSNPHFDDFSRIGSRGNKHPIRVVDEDCEIEAEDLGESDTLIREDEEPVQEEIVYEKSDSRKSGSTASSLNSQDLNYSSGEDDEEDPEQNEDDEEEEGSYETASDDSDIQEVYAYIRDFPTQMICLEKCDGTLDSLFVEEQVDKDTGAAYLMQIIMTLIIYQRAFHFTHNDLHTNNIMYINTDVPFLYYKFEGKWYKVPTYGKIFKLIDFGRSIYRFDGKLFCSDSFAPGGDAHTQYNCEPYLSEKKPRIDPNPSFDLCRLGCSIYDFVIDDENDKRDAFQETIWRWCQDDNGKNVLYKRNGEERYPNFKLYKMIARNVHKHIPEQQLKTPLFDQFRISAKKAAKVDVSDAMDIDNIPSYISP
jgi:hypothetical protein